MQILTRQTKHFIVESEVASHTVAQTPQAFVLICENHSKPIDDSRHGSGSFLALQVHPHLRPLEQVLPL